MLQYINSHGIKVDQVSLILWALVQGAVVSCESFPSSMEVISHHIDKVQVSVKKQKKTRLHKSTEVSMTYFHLSALPVYKCHDSVSSYLLGNLCNLIPIINCPFASWYSSAQHQSGSASSFGLSLIGLNSFLQRKTLINIDEWINIELI